MVDLNDWNRWAAIRWHLLEAALLDQPVVRERIDQELGQAVKRPGRARPTTGEPSSS
jgi:hypothetical protein